MKCGEERTDELIGSMPRFRLVACLGSDHVDAHQWGYYTRFSYI